ncbi:MAG: endolytic transglycosylase MltG [Clostridia bacterium]|nr:endolytic transglycosylase MltG [Clostridia bacterium]
MAHRNKRRKGNNAAYKAETYSTSTIHEEREYGLYWYAGLWKIIRPVMIFLCSMLIVIGMVTMAYDRIYGQLFAPADRLSTEVVEFVVDSGTTVAKVGSNLEEAGLIRSGTVFRYMVQIEGLASSMSYGTYKLSPAMNVNEVITVLTNGSQTSERVITIVPGWTCEDIANYLVGIGALDNTTEFLRLCNDADRFAGTSYALTAAAESPNTDKRKYALEGYLAPDTYRIFLSATPESIIATLLKQDNNVVDRTFYADNTEYAVDEEGNYSAVETFQTPLTMDQTLTLASMIEKEAANPIDYARVSAVFHNRLAQGIRLESDPTVTYLSGDNKLVLSDAELTTINAYNTYVIQGLPAGPICNPSIAAIEAALHPDEAYIADNYLYFCATEPGSGILAFARTKDEHEENVAKYRPLWEDYDRAHSGN